MHPNEETRRTGKCGRASENVLARTLSDIAQEPIVFNQIAWLTARYDVGEAHARLLAELAFARRPQR